MSEMNSKSPVLVIGGGPTGLTMASELLRHGVPCRVIEKLQEPSDKSKALAIHARTLEMLENMNLVDKMIAAGIITRCFSLYAANERIVQLSMAEIESPYPFILMIPQQETERVLREHFESLGGKIERGIELVSLTQSKDAVTAKVRHADGREETIVTPWLVGCDGSHSTVRKQLQLPFEGTAYEERFALADVDVESTLPEDEVSTFFHEDGPMVYFPMGNKRFRIMAPVDDAQITGDAPTIEFVQSVANKRCRPDIKFTRSYWLAWFRIHRRSVPKYRVDRVFLGGDSAHIHSPVGGQGMNTGMQDVYNLAWKLALVYKGLANSELLESYQEERHPVGQELLKGTDMATKVAILRNPIGKQIRNHVIAFLSQQEIFVQRMRKVATMMGVNYRNSKIVGEYHEIGDVQLNSAKGEGPGLPGWMEFARAPLPGEHAPDMVLTTPQGKSVRLYEAIRGTKHSLLLFDGKPTEEGYRNLEKIANVMKRLFGDVVDTHIVVAGDKVPAALKGCDNVYCDPELEAHNTYGSSSEGLFLIRPDGYIGFRSQPAKMEPVVEHLNKLLGKAAVAIG